MSSKINCIAVEAEKKNTFVSGNAVSKKKFYPGGRKSIFFDQFNWLFNNVYTWRTTLTALLFAEKRGALHCIVRREKNVNLSK